MRSSVTGTLESVAPNAASPSSVTVDGASYELGTASASLAVSQLGSFSVGDSVALLLGSDGFLNPDYGNGDGIHLGPAGFEVVLENIRTHAVQ